jgi:hypothetical protein
LYSFRRVGNSSGVKTLTLCQLRDPLSVCFIHIQVPTRAFDKVGVLVSRFVGFPASRKRNRQVFVGHTHSEPLNTLQNDSSSGCR